jgi:hypothetical protein
MGAIRSADGLAYEPLTASGRQPDIAGDNHDSFDGETVRASALVALDDVRGDLPAKSDNAAVSALKQNLHAVLYQRDRANQELQTMLKRRELLLAQIDRCSREISEIAQAIRKLDTPDGA